MVRLVFDWRKVYEFEEEVDKGTYTDEKGLAMMRECARVVVHALGIYETVKITKELW